MRYLSLPIAIAGAAIYTIFDILWLASANSSSVGESNRPVLKGACLAGAALTFLAISALLSTRAGAEPWVRKTATTSAMAVIAGVILMVAVSALWYQGQFFHDADGGEHILAILVMIVASGLGGAFGAVIIGALVRWTTGMTVV